jgi:hypothetical protein
MRTTNALFGIFIITLVLSVQVQGQSGYALFSRPTDTILINGHTLVTNQITIEAEILISSALPAPASSYPRIFEEQSNGQEDKTLWASPSLVGGSSWVLDNQGPQGYGQQLGVTNEVAEDVWHHVAFVHDSNELRVYLDGVQIGIQDFSGDPSIANSSNGVMSIGAFLYDDGSWLTNSFIGAIQWVRVSCLARYSGALATPPATVPASDAFTQVLFDFTHVAPGTSIVYDLGPNQFTGTVGVGFSGATAPSFVQPDQSFLTNGLVAFYPFNGGVVVTDESGNGNNGQIVGNDWRFGLNRFGIRGALYLNTNDPPNNSAGTYVAAPRSAALDFNEDFTLSVWINIPAGLPPYHIHNLISDGIDQTSANFRIISDDDTNGDDYLQFVGGLSDFSSGVYVDAHAFLAPLRNTWWQAVVVRSGTNITLFRNGALAPTTIFAMNATLLNLPQIWLGLMPDSYPLDGGVDDVRMYDRALSALEVQQLYAYESVAQPSVPYGATATAILTNGFIVGANISYGGHGYTNIPTVRFIGGGGSGAQAEAVVSNGVVIAIDFLGAGSGYTSAPLVVIAPPFIPNPALGIAAMSFLTFSNLTVGGVYQLQQLAEGYYWTNQPVNFTAANSVYSQMVSGVAGSEDYRHSPWWTWSMGLSSVLP